MARLARFECPVVVNTVYDPTDGSDALGADPVAEIEHRTGPLVPLEQGIGAGFDDGAVPEQRDPGRAVAALRTLEGLLEALPQSRCVVGAAGQRVGEDQVVLARERRAARPGVELADHQQELALQQVRVIDVR